MADDLAELALGFEHPGGGPPEAHVAVLPALDVAAGAADGLDHRLARVRGSERALEPATHLKPGDGQRFLQALTQRGSRPGMAVGELVGERAELLKRAVVVVERPGCPEAPSDERAVALGQVLEHVSFFVADAALDRR